MGQNRPSCTFREIRLGQTPPASKVPSIHSRAYQRHLAARLGLPWGHPRIAHTRALRSLPHALSSPPGNPPPDWMRAWPEIRLYSPDEPERPVTITYPSTPKATRPQRGGDGRLLDSGHLRVEHSACVCPALALFGGVTFLSGDSRVFLSRDDKRRLCCHGVPHESQ